MENENLEEGRGKKGQARQAGRTQDDEWGAMDRLKKSFRNYADTRKKKTAHLDEENLDELSKKTLGNYIKRSADELEDRGSEKGRAGAKEKWDKYEDAERKGYNKRQGIKNATNKLTGQSRVNANEEVEQIDELSKNKLSKYIHRAVPDVAANYHDAGMEFEKSDQKMAAGRTAGGHTHSIKGNKLIDKGYRRLKGIRTATTKLAKEEFEQIDELSKQTLGNYIKRASDDKAERRVDQVLHSAGMGDKKPTQSSNEKMIQRTNSRRAGIAKAVRKLTKEDYVDALTEEGLQAIEIGINEYFLTLGEEIDQETFDAMVEDIAANLVTDLTEAEEAGSILEFNNKNTKKSKHDIIENVVDKYATEVEYEEISEEDHIIDVLSKHIHEKQIEKVLDLYDSLDEENREELLDLIETKEGINEVINFIIEDSKVSEEE